MIDKLRPGMTKSQVRFVMGHPIVQDPLNDSRWIYYYSISIAGGPLIHRELQLYFVDNRLSHFEGDFAPTRVKEAAEKARKAQEGAKEAKEAKEKGNQKGDAEAQPEKTVNS